MQHSPSKLIQRNVPHTLVTEMVLSAFSLGPVLEGALKSIAYPQGLNLKLNLSEGYWLSLPADASILQWKIILNSWQCLRSCGTHICDWLPYLHWVLSWSLSGCQTWNQSFVRTFLESLCFSETGIDTLSLCRTRNEGCWWSYSSWYTATNKSPREEQRQQHLANTRHLFVKLFLPRLFCLR